ncbi:hypothetical protein GNI_004550 [Gregarina niphandrodes]|uniref:Uncharacterized protein n=1 Tax=Gregarina niphandrodes TaxID=110365 RepID=A0A023BDE7_GRENI|nr:hypothetical protein GNI_004550 [Gregarina niphandrodes]EZG88485.1 hypothetical protein GNI_004550 [Gregarina niphandrodes]|eukprot:XP_011128558.1 hypothetical protein GNI_004550 [Gregarina niphandrodes]
MTAPGDGDLEAVCLVNGGLRVVCSCSSEGLAVYDPNDLEDAKNKIGGLAFSLHTCVALGDDFVITAGETGQVLVAQVSSLRWIGVFDELNIAPPTTTGEPEKKQVAAPEPQGIAANDVMALDDASSEEDEELSRKLLSVDSIVVDRAKTVAAFIDNCYGLVIFRHLDAAFRIIQGVDVGKRTNYAEFMDEL